MLKKDRAPATCLPASILLASIGVLMPVVKSPAFAEEPAEASGGTAHTARIAVFNIEELGADKIDTVDADGRGAHPQLLAGAEVIRLTRPDVLLLNEIDYDSQRDFAADFQELYLAAPRPGGPPPIRYEYSFAAPVNTGVQSGYDFDNNGKIGDPDDGWGFGQYPGQYGMALLSRWPLDAEAARTFRGLRWITMPGHLIPDGRGGRPEWYTAEEASLLRLSSKSFWDVAVELPGGLRVHLLCSHPTPPVFDGDEDRNGRRNYDEVRLVADYLHGGERADWMVDDRGVRGGLNEDVPVVVLGDLNADPVRGAADYGQRSIAQLLEHPRLQDPEPRSDGDIGVHPRRGPYPGDGRTRTSGFGRIDYALPSKDLKVVSSGVFLPPEDHPDRHLVEGDGRASDHFLVWVDIALPRD